MKHKKRNLDGGYNVIVTNGCYDAFIILIITSSINLNINITTTINILVNTIIANTILIMLINSNVITIFTIITNQC